MESFSSLVETFLSVIKSIINNNILLPTGNIWISDVLIYHLFLVILITAIFSLIFNKLIIVFIRGWLRKSNFNIGKQFSLRCCFYIIYYLNTVIVILLFL